LRVEGNIEIVINRLNQIISSQDEKKNSILFVGVTFLVNFITMNEPNQDLIWDLCFPHFFKKLLEISDRELLQYTSMLIYNCSCNSYTRRKILCSNGLDLLRTMLDKMTINGTAAEDNAFDWIYLIFKSSIEFIPSYYPLLNPANDKLSLSTEQFEILYLLEVTLENQENSLVVTPELAMFLLSEFMSTLNELNRGEKARDTVLKAIPIFVDIFGSITGSNSKDLNYQLTTKGLVHIIILFCKQLDKFNDTHTSSWFGMKTKLIRMIANLAYENSLAQDTVREEGGIPLVLESCIIKDSNPYMREWSILALRNLCLDNELNQQYISNLKAQGIPEQAQEEMNKLGVRMELGIDGKIKFFRQSKN